MCVLTIDDDEGKWNLETLIRIQRPIDFAHPIFSKTESTADCTKLPRDDSRKFKSAYTQIMILKFKLGASCYGI